MPTYDTFAEFVLNLSQPSTKIITVDWETVDGTAVAGTDYEASSGTVTFQPGDLTKPVQVPCVTPSGTVQKQFSLKITSVTGATVDATASTPVILAPPPLYLKGADGLTLRASAGTPDASTGNDGDWYIDTTAWKLYGPKTLGVWPAQGVSLIGPAGAAGAPGADGAAGPAGADGTSILTGTGAPAASLGVDGDVYLDTAAMALYAPKAAGAWPAQGVTLTGPAGADGAAGPAGPGIISGARLPSAADGVNGDFWLNTSTSTLYGPKASGAWPSSGTSLIGPQGPKGDAGTGLTNKGAWTSGTTYDPSDYVFSANASGGTSIFVCVSETPFTSTTDPLDDPGNWVALTTPAGPAGVDGNTVLHGSGAPANTLGGNDDFYIDTTAWKIYGPKASGAWPSSGTSLIGPQGAAGATGATGATGAAGAAGTNGNTVLHGSGAPSASLGANGDFYIDTAATVLYGPKASGAWPSSGTSLIGPQGPAGSGGGGSGSTNLVAVTTADVANQQTTIQELCNVTVAAGQAYFVRGKFITRPSDNTKGLVWGVTGSFGPLNIQLLFKYRPSASGMVTAPLNNKASTVTFATSENGNSGNILEVEGLLLCTQGGTFGIGYAVATQYDYQAVLRGGGIILEPLGAVSTN